MILREFIQHLTAVITIITVIVLLLMAYKDVMSWRYVVLPILIGIQRIIFYAVVFIQNIPPSELFTKLSAIITFEEAAALLIVVTMYWFSKNKYG